MKCICEQYIPIMSNTTIVSLWCHSIVNILWTIFTYYIVLCATVPVLLIVISVLNVTYIDFMQISQ